MAAAFNTDNLSLDEITVQFERSALRLAHYEEIYAQLAPALSNPTTQTHLTEAQAFIKGAGQHVDICKALARRAARVYNVKTFQEQYSTQLQLFDNYILAANRYLETSSRVATTRAQAQAKADETVQGEQFKTEAEFHQLDEDSADDNSEAANQNNPEGQLAEDDGDISEAPTEQQDIVNNPENQQLENVTTAGQQVADTADQDEINNIADNEQIAEANIPTDNIENTENEQDDRIETAGTEEINVEQTNTPPPNVTTNRPAQSVKLTPFQKLREIHQANKTFVKQPRRKLANDLSFSSGSSSDDQADHMDNNPNTNSAKMAIHEWAIPKPCKELRPKPLSKDARPEEFRVWEQMYRAYYDASNLDKTSPNTQLAFILTCLDTSLAQYLSDNAKPNATSFSSGTDSLLYVIQQYFNLHFPLHTRRAQLFRLEAKTGVENPDTEFARHFISMANDAKVLREDPIVLMATLMATKMPSEQLRIELLREPAPDLTLFLSKAIEYNQACNKSNKRGQVDAITSSKGKGKNKGKSNAQQGTSKPNDKQNSGQSSKCNKCTRDHQNKPCPALNRFCSKCGQKGHFGSNCPKHANAVSNVEQDQEEHEGTVAVYKNAYEYTDPQILL